MKLVISLLFASLILLTTQCDNSNDLDEVDISSLMEFTTIKTSYSPGENIEVEIINNSQDTLPMFFRCFGSNYTPIDGCEKLDNNNWVHWYLPISCTANLLPSIWANSNPGLFATSYFTTQDQTGTFRLRSKIIYNSDTLFFYSNEYTVE